MSCFLPLGYFWSFVYFPVAASHDPFSGFSMSQGKVSGDNVSSGSILIL